MADKSVFSHLLSSATLIALFAASTFSIGAHAQAQENTALEEIVIIANRTPLEVNKVGSTVEVIDEEELQKHSQYELKDYLERLPGISFAQNGPAGSTSTIRIRGASGKYVKLLVDGIDISDPSGTQTLVAFQHLLVGDVKRIEILKGSQSTLYGSEAVAGVISISTKTAENGSFVRAGTEYGQYNTKVGHATVGYGNDKGNFTFSAQGIHTDGFSALDENDGYTEDDGYENRTFSGRGEFNVTNNVSIFFAARSLYAKNELDDNSATDPENPAYDFTTKQKAGRVGTNITLFDGAFQNTFALQAMNVERDNVTSFPNSFEGGRVKAEYKGVMELDPRLTFMFGADHERTSALTSDGVDESVELNGIFAQLLVEPIKNVNITAGVRRDDHETFGQFDTYRVTGAWYIPESDTKFRASYGTAFRAPSLYELYAPHFISGFPPFGNTNLQPEESEGWDVGIDQTLAQGRLALSATYFNLDTENLIDFVSTDPVNFIGAYYQIPGITKRRGVEVSAKAQITNWLSASAAYTYTIAREANGDRLARQPRNLFTLGADIRPTDKTLLTVTANIVDDTVYKVFGVDGTLPLDDYVLVNAKLSYDVNENWSAYIRGENLLNDEYQTVNGYGTSDLAVYGGVTYRMGE